MQASVSDMPTPLTRNPGDNKHDGAEAPQVEELLRSKSAATRVVVWWFLSFFSAGVR